MAKSQIKELRAESDRLKRRINEIDEKLQTPLPSMLHLPKRLREKKTRRREREEKNQLLSQLNRNLEETIDLQEKTKPNLVEQFTRLMEAALPLVVAILKFKS
ncbi:6566_t:CDS:1 [Acaulospora colombiana]|uniref:6566_t:CDS:1 n=1 Tax=Acaulospora colombiana TaxID=27376 RepID=A0ACA9JZT6_9GLOM|nr:6566_t:CDS:1 [Acaulospora colombiana]